MNRFSALVNLPRLSTKPASIAQMLHQELLCLSACLPYRAARLYRIADQLEYALQHWPAGNSSSTNKPGQQDAKSLLPQLAHFKATVVLCPLPPAVTLDRLQAELLGLLEQLV